MSLLPEKDWANNEIKKDNERQFFVGPPRQNLKWMSIKREKVVRGKNECIHFLYTFQLIDGNI